MIMNDFQKQVSSRPILRKVDLITLAGVVHSNTTIQLAQKRTLFKTKIKPSPAFHISDLTSKPILSTIINTPRFISNHVAYSIDGLTTRVVIKVL